MKRLRFAVACTFLLAGCGQSARETTAQDLVAEIDPGQAADEAAPDNKFGFREELAQGPDLFGSREPSAQFALADEGYAAADAASDALAISKAQAATPDAASRREIAYSYAYGFRIGRDRIAELQQAHIASCDALGAKCRVLRVSQSRTDWDGFGEVKLQVAAGEVGAFAKALSEPADKLGGELISSVRDGEDLSDTIIDAEAHLQSRLVLRDKLTAILKASTGSVAELIKAEQAVSDVNEEIDAARSKLASYRTRIAMSAVSIRYEPEYGESQLGFARPVMTALRSIGTTLGTTTAVLIYILTAMVPITLMVLAIRWVLHRFGFRFRFWRIGFRPSSVRTEADAGGAANG